MAPSPPGSGPLSRVREALRTVVLWISGAVSGFASWVYRGVMSLKSPAARESLLIGIAYVTGVAGLVVSVLGDPTDPTSRYGTVGIGLMGVSFVCLFVVSVSVLRATGGEQ